MAVRLDLPIAIVEKRRLGNTGSTEALNVIGDVAGRNALLVDDEIDTAGTMVQAVNILREKGAGEVLVAGYHAILSGPAVDRLRDADVHEIVVTDT
ncbi:MAG: ribose-phosphate diphosphokinase, partial [Dehalococcoidia bacterium]|nr:ribose-phosphate diphosphokinase [Dehalococcoidia bacterium]